MRIADQLRTIRAKAGLTQAAMAKRLGVALRTYHGWEHNLGQPRAATWERIKLICGVAK